MKETQFITGRKTTSPVTETFTFSFQVKEVCSFIWTYASPTDYDPLINIQTWTISGNTVTVVFTVLTGAGFTTDYGLIMTAESN